MHPEVDPRLGFQPDIYQRYGFLARLLEAVLGTPRDNNTPPETSALRRYRLLDVGSGPARLAEAFLPDWIEPTRADVTAFGDPSIVQIPLEGPLPFPDDTFEIVVAMDVLEHLPADRRARLIEECQRVAGRALIVGGPVRSPHVTAAERVFAEFAQAISGRELDFLAEHARFGLPDCEEVVGPLDARAWHVVTIENSPLAEWQLFNAIDFFYACDVGDGEPKRATNAYINGQTFFRREGEPHYRVFVCAFRDEADAALTRKLAASPAVVGPPLSSVELASTAPPLLQRLQLDLRGTRTALETIISAKDTHIETFTNTIRQFSEEAQEVNQRLAEMKDAAAEREAALSAVTQEAAARQASNHELERTLEAKEVLTASLEQEIDSLQSRNSAVERTLEAKQEFTSSLERHLAARSSTADRLTRELAELQEAHAAIVSSLWWRISRPARVTTRRARSLLRRFARWPQRGAAPTAGSPGFESSVLASSVLAASPLFDREWYQSLTPETHQAEDPVLHYLSRGRQDGRNPHPLFDAAFYLQRNPDVEAAGIDPLVHYIVFGSLEGRHPHPLFDVGFYLSQGADVTTTGDDPLTHYLTRGALEGFDPHPLFETAFYLAQNPDVAAARTNPLAHFAATGAREGRNPHPLFDTRFYLQQNPDVEAAGINPLVHYTIFGSLEARLPHPLFDVGFYLAQCPELTTMGLDPLTHYLTRGASEGLDPHPLFDTTFYAEQNPDVAAAGINPLAHFVVSGTRGGCNPHPLFDTRFYREQNPDVAAAKVNPLVHYLTTGAREGRDPHRDFDSSFYLESNPDVAAAGENPLVHFVLRGKNEGRLPRAAARADTPRTYSFYVPPQGLLPWFDPLNLSVSQRLSNEPRLNVLLPGLGMRHLSGGPNTALALAARLARGGIRIRLMSTDQPPDRECEPLWAHIRDLLGAELPSGIELVDAHDRSQPIEIGDRDIFLATAWWTAQQAKYAVKLTRHQRFVYLIQDYEPLMHAASTQQALAAETYGLDHIPVVNSEWLAEFLVQERVGRFSDPEFAGRALVFQPAVDRTVFHPRERRERRGRRRLLFYARPTNGLRNLFELGIAALQKAIADGTLDPADWEFVAMGEAIAPVPLGSDAILKPAPWLDLHGYARQMRESDLLLGLMLSPHPSYPPLEMAVSAGVAVTTCFGTKTVDRMSRLSPNILMTEPTIEAVAKGLAEASVRAQDWDGRIQAARIDLPQSWDESFAQVVPALVTRLLLAQGSPTLVATGGLGDVACEPPLHPAFRSWPVGEYDVYRRDRLKLREVEYPAIESPGLISFLTPVWNTDPGQLEELVQSVLGQDVGANYEWVVLDNGSDRAETRAILKRIASDPRVRLYQSPENLGIIAGTRYCLERAAGRYAATVDHDDLLAPDCVRVLTHALVRYGFPEYAYTDEDKLDGQKCRDPYFKPDWDPVLFSASCYTAHLILFDRSRALELGAYTDRRVEGSHDWDTFTRFAGAGLVPLHIAEVLYTWRMHSLSTAGNFQSKPYVFASQRVVLEKIVAQGAWPDRFHVEPCPLFEGTPDWWIRRDRVEPRGIVTALVGARDEARHGATIDPAIQHEVVAVPEGGGCGALASLAARCADEGRLLHILWADTAAEGDEWPWEAMGVFERLPDTAVVGGRILRRDRVLDAGSYFGFGRGCDSPDRGRSASDPGYFVQMWKPHSVSAVPVRHCVVEPNFLVEFLAYPAHANLALCHLAAWLGAYARRRGRRVVYSPLLSAEAPEPVEPTDPVEWATFRRIHAALIPETAYLSPRLGLDPSTAYRPVSDEARRASLAAADRIDDAIALDVDRAAREILYRPDGGHTTFSLLTSVYARTDSELFDRTSASVLSLNRAFDEWVLLVNGPVAPEVERIVTRLSDDSRVKVIREPVNVGIVRAMRRCLEAATCEYVLPLDADDLLEPDIVSVLDCALTQGTLDFGYADEDILSGDDRLATFTRPPFDPVLNLETSYIWHPCAFRRACALELGVYSDAGAEYCHDWDTVVRFADARLAIGHVPHVLYHWRTHAASESHSGTQNAGSIASTRHLLRRVLARQKRPELYDVRPFPIFRGAEEWYIARRHEAPPEIALVHVTGDRATVGEARLTPEQTFPFKRALTISTRCGWLSALAELASVMEQDAPHVAIVSDDHEPIGHDWPWEAIRLLEMHPEVAVVSGRTVDDQGIIWDAGRRAGHWSREMNDFVGLHRTAAGPFALALKAHCVDEPCDTLLVVETGFLRAAVQLARETVPRPLGQLLAGAARLYQRRIAYSPLLQATRHQPTHLIASSAVRRERQGV